MPVDPKRVQVVFRAAVEEADPSLRGEVLAGECGSDADLRRRVEALLKAHDEPDSDLDRPAVALVNGTINYEPIAEQVGTKIGPYVLREQIGEGGFGLVFVAEQTEPVKRKVALKVIKPGMDTREVISRFEAERQALALMDHPNIARVLDAGATASGRPYFVMELVRGVPITEYCDKNQLPPKDRLGIFVTVCQAIQHAHQKGIIHRDVKPSNVLVTSHDGKPVAKVIDFGVAKAIHQQLTARTIYTNFAQMVGTPLYMSPEQAEMSGLDIDTRSDIYSLGVLLYELLTGTTPLEKKHFAKAAYDEIRRLIREQEPPRPSTRVSTSDSIASIAAQRHTEPGKLSKLMRGDLDWITMKCLEKDRTRRYETANGLARDLQRYLSDEPVEACPPSTTYRLRKFARKNRAALTTAATIAVLLVGGIAVSTWQAVRATRAEAVARQAQWAEAERAEGERLAKIDSDEKRRQAEQAAAAERTAKEQTQKRLAQIEKGVELFAGMLSGINPRSEQQGGEPLYVQLRQRAEKAADGLDAEAVGDPLAVARLQTILGTTLRGLGSYAKAVGVLEKARAVRERDLGADHADTLATLNLLAGAYEAAGRLPDAIALFEQVRDAQVKKPGADQLVTLVTLSNLAGAYQAAGRLPEAIALYEQVRDAQVKKPGPDRAVTLVTLNNLAVAYQAAGRLPEAIALFEQVRDARVKKLGADHADTLNTFDFLGLAYLAAGRLPEATALFQQVRDVQVKKLGPDHPSTLATLNNLGLAYRAAGRLPEAIALYEQVRDVQVKNLGADHPSTLTTLDNLAGAYKAAERLPEAIALYEQVRDGRVKKLGADHPHTFITLNNLAGAYQAAHRLSEAIALFEQVRDAQVKKLGADHPHTLTTLHNLAAAYRAAGRLPKAIALFEQVRDAQVKKLGAGHPDTLTTLDNLAGAYKAARRLPEAIALYEQVRDGRVKKLGADHPNTLTTLNNLAGAYKAAERLPEAIALYEQIRDARVKKLGADHRDTLNALNNLALAYRAADRLPDAIALFEQVRDAKVKKLGADDPDTLTTLNNLAGAYKAAGRLPDAILLYEQAAASVAKQHFQHEYAGRIIPNTCAAYEQAGQLDRAEGWRRQWLAVVKERSGADSPDYAGQLAGLGSNLLKQKKWADAEPILRECLAIREKQQPDAWTTFNTMSALGGALLGQKKYADAEPLLLKGYQGMKQREDKVSKEGKSRLPEAVDRLIELYTAENRPEDVKTWQAERAKYKDVLPPPGQPI